MAGLSPDVLRVGKKYRLTNYGESSEFVIEEIFSDRDMRVKDLHTLETYRLFDLMKFGKGNDFIIEPYA